MARPSRRQPGHLPSDAVIARGAAGVLAVFVVVGGALFLLSFLGGSADRSGGVTPTRTPSALPTRALSPSPTASPTATPAPTPTGSAVRARAMAAFVRDYLATVTRSPATAWRRLTPAFQTRSGGFPAYERFWGSVLSARPSGVRADPDTMTVEYDVAYVRRDGSRSTDHPRLVLQRQGDGYLIAGEA